MAQWLICRLHFGGAGERCNSRPARWKIKVPRRRARRETRGEPPARDEKWILRRRFLMRVCEMHPKRAARSPNTARSCPPRQINYRRIINNRAGRRTQTSSPACCIMLNAHTVMRECAKDVCLVCCFDSFDTNMLTELAKYEKI
jgi:hypothetical protein